MIQNAIRHPVLYRNLKQIKVYDIKQSLAVTILKSHEPVLFSEIGQHLFTPIKPGGSWGRIYDCAWLRLEGTLPPGLKNPLILIDTNAEGLVYTSDGEPYATICRNWVPIDPPVASGAFEVIEDIKSKDGSIDLLIDCGYNGLFGLDLVAANFKGAFIAEKNTEAQAYFYDYLTLFLLSASTGEKALNRKIVSALMRSFNAYRAGSVSKARELLKKQLDEPSNSSFTFSAVGHGHLDLAWLWPERETVRKAARTYIKALNNIEKYPDYIYGTSQPQQLEWMKVSYPGIYNGVKRAINDGRIEMQGGFWCECDTNITGGESLIHQAIYGKRFTREEFGLEAKTCWLPDAFGFSGNLPQIIRGCGMEYFYTIKISWNKTNVFPHRTFIWKGIDGTGVVSHMSPEGDYNSQASAHSLLKALKKYPEREMGSALLVYGLGDGGGGPGESHLELLSRERDLLGLPKTEMSSASAFFKKLGTPEKTYTGELYLETHQGTYTTQAKIKYYNRLCERLLHNAEFLAAADGETYPKLLENVWKNVLLYQFHDILPGSSVTRVNYETVKGYITLEAELNAYIAEKLCADKDAPLAFANLTPFVRNEYVKHEEKWYSINIAPYSSQAPEPASAAFGGLHFTKDSLSNGILTLHFAGDGSISSCTDNAGNELSGGYLNRLMLYTDIPVDIFNAWNIDIHYLKKPRKRLTAAESKYEIDGPCVYRVNKYRFGKSAIKQRIILEAGSDTVWFETTVDWHESHKMLRADFRPADYGDTAKCEIQFGHIERPTTENNSVERAQFEVCAHKWIAVTGKENGFALLNDCKYGHRIKKGIISLNLLRSPKYPDKTADRGKHQFTYAFCPFKPDDLSKVIREGYRLNNPLLPARRTFGTFADVSEVVLETVKPAERGKGVILRLYECLGKPATAVIHPSIPCNEVWLTDMLENCIEKISPEKINFAPFEIKTILLKLV